MQNIICSIQESIENTINLCVSRSETQALASNIIKTCYIEQYDFFKQKKSNHIVAFKILTLIVVTDMSLSFGSALL